MDSATMSELYKRTPLKKRPVQLCSLSPDEGVSVRPKPVTPTQVPSLSPDERESVKPRPAGPTQVPSSSSDERESVKPRPARPAQVCSSSADERESVKARPVRPIQLCSLSPDVGVERPNLRHSKRLAKSAASILQTHPANGSEPAPNAMNVPVIKTSTETKDSSLVEIGNKPVAPKIPKKTKALGKKNFTKQILETAELSPQELADLCLAIQLQNEQFNLRERRPRPIPSNLNIKAKRKRSSVKIEDMPTGNVAGPSSPGTSSDAGGKQIPSNLNIKTKRKRSSIKTEDMSTENVAGPSSNSENVAGPSSPGTSSEQGEQECKRMPKKTKVNNEEGERDASTSLFTGSHSNKIYTLSPELESIFGNKEIACGTVMTAIHYVCLERDLYDEERKYIICDKELSEKIFEGRHSLLFDDVKYYLHKHLTPAD